MHAILRKTRLRFTVAFSFAALDSGQMEQCLPSFEEKLLLKFLNVLIHLRIKKMLYIYTMEYYSAIKRSETGTFVEMWMDLEFVTQSEGSQKEKQISYINAFMWNLERWY